ncbi:MAG: hypothetical protein WC109_02155 [Syntrophomonadaceae bacterium]|nr:hypothetical protein [Syntrophomonadaceae bacterium]MDD3270918.1 hypothetical protein [Syntrophomonadaceae bacterium]MDD3897483.1 hypothetical protein [Syntrophomonadaceae bacterium]MDD4561937.1 hypothetical protein [Syntrophomonadaceae bacterium]
MFYPGYQQLARRYQKEDCPHGNKPTSDSWVTIEKVYPPQDLVISSLLKSYGIPVRILRREIPQLPVSIGPMAEVQISVPADLVEEARTLLQQAVEESDL